MIKKAASLSETGLKRKNNQDSILAVNMDNAGLFVIADGMGGHYKGEWASQAAVDSLRNWWNGIQKCIGSMPFLDIVAELEKKIKIINEDILYMYNQKGQMGGTTLCLLLIHNNAYAVMNIGDSRLYRCVAGICRQVTLDDVDNLDSGKLTQALGAQKGISISTYTGQIKSRSVFLLCSDGIYKYCGKSFLLSQLRRTLWFHNTDKMTERIRKVVYERGAGDNLSMITILAEDNRK